MKINKLPDKVRSGLVFAKFLPPEENYKYVERNYSAVDQFQYSEGVTAEVLLVGPDCEKYNIKTGDIILLYTKSLLQPRFMEYKKEKYYVVNMENSYIFAYSNQEQPNNANTTEDVQAVYNVFKK